MKRISKKFIYQTSKELPENLAEEIDIEEIKRIFNQNDEIPVKYTKKRIRSDENNYKRI